MLEKTRSTYQSITARVVAYEILKLPHKCEDCGIEGRTEVHHINKDRDNNSRENIRILCRNCHNKVHDVILPKRGLTLTEEIAGMLPMVDNRLKYNSKSRILREKRRLETQKYRDKWGITRFSFDPEAVRSRITAMTITIEGPFLRVEEMVQRVRSLDRGIQWRTRKVQIPLVGKGEQRWRYIMTPLLGHRYYYQNRASRRREHKPLNPVDQDS